jgi:hypothetical protein
MSATSDLATPIIFSNQKDGGVTAQKLNLGWSRATVQPAFISTKPLASSYAAGDYLILLQAAGTYAKIAPSAVGIGGVAINPGTWTALTYSTGWSQQASANFRIETVGAFTSVKCQGIIAYVAGAAPLAFTLPAGARPSVARGCILAGYDSSGDQVSFAATVASATGAVTIVPMVRQAFSWPSATGGNVYLDSLTFSL